MSTIKPDAEINLAEIDTNNLMELYKSTSSVPKPRKKKEPPAASKDNSYNTLNQKGNDVSIGDKKYKGYVPVAGQNPSLGGYAQVGLSYSAHMSVEQALAQAQTFNEQRR